MPLNATLLAYLTEFLQIKHKISFEYKNIVNPLKNVWNVTLYIIIFIHIVKEL